MQITIEGVGTVPLLAQFDLTNPQDNFSTAIVLIDVSPLPERYVVYRVQTLANGRTHAYNGQYYTDRSQALGRFIRRTAIAEYADVPAMAL
jgi:hypothetical protein